MECESLGMGGKIQEDSMNALYLSDRSRVEKAIAQALLDAIHAHGPITAKNRSSAAKRVYGMLKVVKNEQRKAEDEVVEYAMYMYSQPQVDHIQGLVTDALIIASTELSINHARVLVGHMVEAIPEKVIADRKKLLTERRGDLF